MSEAPPDRFERVRKSISWFAVVVFAGSFLALLVLSATDYWQPGNELVLFCDRVWRVSGVTALVLGSIPYVRRFVQSLRSAAQRR